VNVSDLVGQDDQELRTRSCKCIAILHTTVGNFSWSYTWSM